MNNQTKKYDEHSKYAKGNLIKFNRISRNITLREMAERTNISYSRLSKLERGIEKSTNDVFKRIEDALSIKFERDSYLIQTIDDIFIKFINSLFFDNNINKFEALIDNERFLLCENFYKIVIINYIIAVNKGDKNSIQEIENVFSALILVDVECLNIINEYRGYYYFKLGKLDLALNCYNEAIINGKHDRNLAMLYYHMALVYKKKNDLLDMYKAIQKAREIFSEFKAFKRVIYCDMNLATIYRRLGKIQSALEIYDTCIENINDLHISSNFKALAYRNKAWIYITCKDYKNAVIALKESEKLAPNHQLLILYFVWCYMCLDNKPSLNYWITRGSKFITDYTLEFDFLKSLAKNNFGEKKIHRLISKAKKVIEYLEEIGDVDLLEFYKEILIDLYIKENDYKSAFLLKK